MGRILTSIGEDWPAALVPAYPEKTLMDIVNECAFDDVTPSFFKALPKTDNVRCVAFGRR